ncbi:MAG TPA: hypothetical protein VE825_02830 [Terriglobales bacterium]|jgi:hypothetical protein|nr:hypothetical protein [Terriglobales bacterium]
MSQPRPAGVTALGAICVLLGVFFVFFAIITTLIVSPDMWEDMQRANSALPLPQSVPAHGSLAAHLATNEVAGFLLAFVGYGLLKLKPWARWLMIGICLAVLAYGIWFDIGWFRMTHAFAWPTLPFFALYGWIGWYLSRPKVKAAFAADRRSG